MDCYRNFATHTSLRGLDQQADSHAGTAACGRKQMKPREGSTAQIREGQDFLGGDQMPTAMYFGKGKSMRRGKTGDVSGSTELAIVVSRRSWRCAVEKKMLFFSGCKSHPGTGSFHPVAIRAVESSQNYLYGNATSTDRCWENAARMWLCRVTLQTKQQGESGASLASSTTGTIRPWFGN